MLAARRGRDIADGECLLHFYGCVSIGGSVPTVAHLSAMIARLAARYPRSGGRPAGNRRRTIEWLGTSCDNER